MSIKNVSDPTRNNVWFEREETHRLSRYYSSLRDRYIKLNNRIEILMIGLSVLVVLCTFAVQLFPLSQPILWTISTAQLLACGGFIATIVESKNKKLPSRIEILNEINVNCTNLSNEWSDLWQQIETYTIDDAITSIVNSQLVKRRDSYINALSRYNIADDHELNEKCTLEAKEVMESTYARI